MVRLVPLLHIELDDGLTQPSFGVCGNSAIENVRCHCTVQGPVDRAQENGWVGGVYVPQICARSLKEPGLEGFANPPK